MTLKMIIADDEHHVREGLKEVVPWESMGIEVIGTAADGQEAYDLCVSLKPDILLTDIRMPLVDGLEAAVQLKETNIPIRIIIISGAQDFNYAQTALNLNADGYILKPIKLHELEAAIRKVADSIRTERSIQDDTRRLKQQLLENMPALREKFLVNLVSGMFRNEKELFEKLNFFGLDLEKGLWRAALLQVDDYEQAIERYSEENKQLISFSINNVLEEIAVRHHSGIAFCMNENCFVLLFNPSMNDEDRYLQVIQEMIECCLTYLKLSLSAGIGNPVWSVAKLHYSYLEAASAIEYRFFMGNGSILHSSDFNSSTINIPFASIYEDQNKLIRAMKLGKRDEVMRNIHAIFEAISQGNNCPAELVQSTCVELINMASKSFYELGESVESILPPLPDMFKEIYAIRDAAALVELMVSYFNEMTAFFLHKNGQKNSGTIKKIKTFIEQNYMENLTVARISKEIYLTPNYISLIFKQETGESITEHITKVRMEAAKQLLISPDLKILDIAEMVGYENATYFSTVFKKYTGLHPQKFRSLQ